MIIEDGNRAEFKAWVLAEVWHYACPIGHTHIPSPKELRWDHLGDEGMSMSVRCVKGHRDFSDCDICSNMTEQIALKETVRLTMQYLEWFMWGSPKNGTGERKTNRLQTVGAERALALAVLRRA